MATLSLDEYLRLVLPDGGNYFVEYNTRSGRHVPRLCTTLADTALEIRRRAQSRLETWVGIASFGDKRRSDSVVLKKSFYIDIDCGPDKAYKTKDDAKKALNKTIKQDRAIPRPTIVIDSGNGFHLYWVLEAPITPKEWKPIAAKFKAALRIAELHADSKVTADIARILRPPETWNVKDANDHKPCNVLKYYPRSVYTVERLCLLLPAAAPTDNIEQAQPQQPSDATAKLAALGSVDDLISGTNTTPFLRLDDAGKQRVAGEMLDLISKPEYFDDYTKWVNVGKALKDASEMCSAQDANKEWMDIWDTWSQQSKKYETDKLVEKWAALDGLNDIHFGTLVYYAKQEGFVFPNAVQQVAYPPGYIATDFGTIRQAGKGEEHASFVFAAHLHNPQICYDPEYGNLWRSDVVNPVTKERTTLETTVVAMNCGGPGGLPAHLGKANISITNSKQLKEAATFVRAFMDQVASQRGRTERAVKRFGWGEQNGTTAFCAGDRIFWADGTETLSNVPDAELRELYTPRGSLAEWQKMAQAILNQERQEVNFVLATPFAAPLIPFTAVNGVVVSIISRDSGTGKTTALRAAQSVWGRPQGGINALDDTVNAVTRRLEILQNLPAYWDELRMREQVDEFIKLIFQLSQGKGKSRMNSAAVLQRTGTWSTLIGVAGNEPLVSIVNQKVGATDAGALRLLEIEIPPLRTNGVARHLRAFNGLERHYGQAGVTYASWLAQNASEAEDLTANALAKLDAKLHAANSERFWLACIACVYAGAFIATRRIQVVNFDLRALAGFLVKIFLDMRAKLAPKSELNDATSMLRDFINAKSANCLRTNAINLPSSKPGRPPPLALRAPSMPASIRHPLAYQTADDGMVVINLIELRKWLFADRKVTLDVLMPTFTNKMGLQQVDNVIMGAGSPSPSAGAVDTLVGFRTNPALATIFPAEPGDVS